MDIEGVRAAISEAANRAGSLKAWAEGAGLSAQYAGDILHGRREPGEKVLTALGMVKVVEYIAAKPPLVAPSLVDCSQPDNVVQCRHELDRAETPSALVTWARKWGRGLLRGCEEHSDETEHEIASANSAAEDAEADAAAAWGEVEEARSDLDDLLDIVRSVVADLTPIQSSHPSIADLIKRLENEI